MERRAFLGAAAAAAALSGSLEDADEDPAPSQRTVVSEAQASYETYEGVWSAVELGEVVDEETSVSVSGHSYPDDPTHVMLHINQEAAGLVVSVSPKRARELAEDLEGAAEFAEGGDIC